MFSIHKIVSVEWCGDTPDLLVIYTRLQLLDRDNHLKLVTQTFLGIQDEFEPAEKPYALALLAIGHVRNQDYLQAVESLNALKKLGSDLDITAIIDRTIAKEMVPIPPLDGTRLMVNPIEPIILPGYLLFHLNRWKKARIKMGSENLIGFFFPKQQKQKNIKILFKQAPS